MTDLVAPRSFVLPLQGLYVMDAELRDRLKRQGVEATAYVWPSKMSIYASMVPQYNTAFLRAGAQAMSASGARAQGDKRFAAFRGLPVYETEAFGTCLSWMPRCCCCLHVACY